MIFTANCLRKQELLDLYKKKCEKDELFWKSIRMSILSGIMEQLRSVQNSNKDISEQLITLKKIMQESDEGMITNKKISQDGLVNISGNINTNLYSS